MRDFQFVSLLIARRLEAIASTRAVSGINVNKKKMLVFELCIGLLVPILVSLYVNHIF
jgi:hypothetical protein